MDAQYIADFQKADRMVPGIAAIEIGRISSTEVNIINQIKAKDARVKLLRRLQISRCDEIDVAEAEGAGQKFHAER
ncbi:hypothetical protein D3C86_2096390 [compost metagenome]